jgi:2'-5' RNA ligase
VPDAGTGGIEGAVATQRLFFALWPGPELQLALARLGRELLGRERGRPVAADNLHLTLAFLGSVDAGARACLERAAEALRGEPFTLRFDRAGWFPRPKVFWLGCPDTPAPLAALVEGLRSAQRGCGLEPEARPWAAHLTLARKVARRPRPLPFAPVEWPVARFALVESHTGPEGVRYEPLRFWPL